MGIERLPDGQWYGKKMVNGKRKGSLLHHYTEDKTEPRTRAEAQVAFENFCGAVRTGKAFMPENIDKKISVAQFVQYYKDTYWAKKERTGNGDISIMNKVAKHFGDKPIAVFSLPATFTTFNKALATEFITVRKKVDGKLVSVSTGKKRSAKTLGEYAKRVKHMAEKAYAGDFIENNPFLKDPDLMADVVASKGRKRGVTEDELKALYKACAVKPAGDGQLDEANHKRMVASRQLMKDRLDVTVKLGLRRKEMQYLQLEDVDYDNWTITIHARKTFTIDGQEVDTRTSKSVETREIPIDTLKPLFLRKREEFGLRKKAFLFGVDGVHTTEFDTAWASLKRDAGLDDVTLTRRKKVVLHWHDLRGEAGTRMLENGADPIVIAEFLGHSKEVFAKHYKRNTLELMRKAVGK